MLIERQLNFMLARDYPQDIVDAKKFVWQIRDVEPRNKLKIAPGLMAQGFIFLEGLQSYVASLPIDYDSTQYLHFVCMASLPTTVTVTRSPTTGSNYFGVFGTNSTAEGAHPGQLCFQETGVTQIEFANVVSANRTEIAWFMFQMPPLQSQGSWKDGVQTLGVIP
jgi:hypothetical protein